MLGLAILLYGRPEVAPWLVALGSLLMLVLLVLEKRSSARFRQTAVPVSGVIVRRFLRSRETSYYVRYTFEGRERMAEYCAPSLGPRCAEGETLHLLIDPAKPPDVPLPQGILVWSGSRGGSCELQGSPLWGFWDVAYACGCTFGLVWSVWPWLRPLLAAQGAG